MYWPIDHPVNTDPALCAWAPGAQELCPEASVVSVLRHLSGRRVATLVDTDRGLGVLKVFASPRARGNLRRVRALRGSSAGALVPEPWGVDNAGHVSLVAFVAGPIFDSVDDDRFVDVAEQAGQALRQLHESGIVLDRAWTIDDELRLLAASATAASQSLVDQVLVHAAHLANEPLISAHRDCHPKQLVSLAGKVCWIDLDDAAMAPSGLDVGNMIAHLRRDGLLGRRSLATTEQAIVAFRSGYGPSASDVDIWERLSLLRLAALAETRHRNPNDAQQILSLIATSQSSQPC